MTVTLVMVFTILAAFAFGFLCGRIWQIRCDELQRRASLGHQPSRTFRARVALKLAGRLRHRQNVVARQLTFVSTRAAQPTCSRNRQQPPRHR
jgi:hypothetical protein